jgi:hypothetical protein
MLKIVEINTGLFKFLRGEFKNKRPVAKRIKILLDVGKRYIQLTIGEYRAFLNILSNAEYREKIKKYRRMTELKNELQKCINLMGVIDKRMIEMGANRFYRKQFWRDFVKNGTVRKDFFDELLKQIR